MKFNKNVIAILAIFLVVISASAVCAEDSSIATDEGQDGAAIDGGAAADTAVDNTTAEPASDITNTTNNTVVDNTTNTTNTTNITTNGTTNSTNSTSPLDSLAKFATGNPILILLAVFAVIGVYTMKRK